MHWSLQENLSEDKINLLATSLNVDPIIAKLLYIRGIESFEQAKQFFRPSLTDLHNPYLMKDMDLAVSRIEKAIVNKERILVFGDYDVDGTTAVSLVAGYLRGFYPEVDTYIPDRYAEGYGISYQGIDYASDNEISLIIALDCGIKSIQHVEYAKLKNIDFIICDHHRPGNELPKAVAVLDPKRADCNYPFDELCGCGIGFKLIQALGQNRGETIEDLKPFLDLVATAIAADIVPIVGENRTMAYFGLEVINTKPRIGLQALLERQKKKRIEISDVVFFIAPRINAAGRIYHGKQAVALLCEYDIDQATSFALEIEEYNLSRRALDQQITQEAFLQIEENQEQNRHSTVVYNENWHKGVIGIVASRLTEVYYRPTLVFTKSGDKLAASARSVQGFDVYNALEACSEFLEQFGGHAFAAGLTLKEENYLLFKEAFEDVVSKTLTEDQKKPILNIDSEICFEELNPKFLRILKQFQPFGPGNRNPVFLAKNVMDSGYAKTIGSNEEHLKLFVKQNSSEGIGAIGFGIGSKLDLVRNKKPFDMVFSIEENEFNDKIMTQFNLKDLR